MGTYTTNKNLFMPTIGETGWGTLVNGNFETIDTLLKPISLSGSTYTFNGAKITSTSFNGVVLKNSGTITVNPTSTTKCSMPSVSTHITLLPLIPGIKYTGSLKFGNTTGAKQSCYYFDGLDEANQKTLTLNANTTSTITFSNISFLICQASTSNYTGTVVLYDYTFA